MRIRISHGDKVMAGTSASRANKNQIPAIKPPADLTKEPWAQKLATVREVETKDIRKRRRQMKRRYAQAPSGNGQAPAENNCSMVLPADRRQPLDDLVGVALSGGGIRSAAVSMGLLESLHETGIIKFVDYLSTVSGGGYAGSAYSAAMQSAASGPDAMFPSPPPGGTAAPSKIDPGYPAVLRRIIYGGEYLVRPWEAANKYLVGLFFNNLLLLSGVVALCTAIAIAWRMLDFQSVRDALGIVRLDWDAYVTFLPFCFFLGGWVLAWSASYSKHRGEAPGVWAQRLLYFTVGSLLIGTTLLLVNGETTLGAYGVFFGGSEKTSNSGTIGKWLLGAIAAALTPLLAPKRLLQMGLAPRGTLDRVVFGTVLTAFCVGVPLAVIGIVGQENISRTRDDPQNNVRLRDIRDWPAFATLLGTSKVATLNEKLNSFYDTQDELKQCGVLYRLWSIIWERGDSPVIRWWRAHGSLDVEKQRLLDEFNKDVLTSAYLPYAMIQERPLFAAANADYWRAAAVIGLVNPRMLRRPVSGPQKQELPIIGAPPLEDIVAFLKKTTGDDKLADSDVQDSIADARLSYQSVWRTADSKEFNLSLLETLHPECFYEPDRIYRFNVIAGDQKTRLWILGISALVFFACQRVDLNSTSLLRFYRNRLAYAYIGPFRPTDPDIPLSKLRNTAIGAPYHILNATVDLRHKTTLDQATEEYLGAEGDQPMEQIFMYSRRYCGCQATGWVRTEHYEQRRAHNGSLANAMALSGAAVSAMMSTSAPQRLLMLALNLNLGQWVQNPKGHGRKSRALPARLVLDWYRRPSEDGKFCFVCDGGFTDNLGIFTLLRRRCRLIIAMDAGCDGKHQFEDLSRIVRAARVHLGIRIVRKKNKRDNDRDLVDMDTELLHLKNDGLCQQHFIVAKIQYPQDENGQKAEGWLVYMKSSLTGDESADILGYRSKVRDFPHESTMDQFYESARLETYRQLGVHIGRTTLKKLFPVNGDHWYAPSLSLRILENYLSPSMEMSNSERMVAQVTGIATSLKATQSAIEPLRARMVATGTLPVTVGGIEGVGGRSAGPPPLNEDHEAEREMKGVVETEDKPEVSAEAPKTA
jgi:hypothetical protein